MKLCLINPQVRGNMWSFERMKEITGAVAYSTPLGLATVAALTPSHWEVEIIDENVEAVRFDTDADLIGMGPFNLQYHRALEIAAEFKRRGKTVVFGGPYCTLSPEAFEGKGTYRVCGEVEYIWQEFLKDFENGVARECYVAPSGKVNLEDSPVPRYDLIKRDHYTLFYIQASRGCPFACEFCDIIVTDGRIPRLKTIKQVVAEVDHCIQQGARYIYFSDANFIGNIPYAKKLLKALGEYSRRHNFPVEFSCELTINVAHHEELLSSLQAANFTNLFIGIESPRRESLLETKKDQNVRRNVKEDIARIHSYHISVIAGMIVGFDSDDQQIFHEQYQFLQELGIPFTTCGTLVALPNTPLEKRLQAEGRLLPFEVLRFNGHGAADCNFYPKRMTLDELVAGYGWLLKSLYSYESYGQRMITLLNRYRNKTKEHKRTRWTIRHSFLPLLRLLRHYLWTSDRDRLRFFLGAWWKTARGGPFSFGKWIEFGRWMAFYPSLRSFVIETQGIPESVDPAKPPFQPELSTPPLREVTSTAHY
jgi:radical SAM superfamily enzyme YgiQ (UPF0313 family)